MRRWLPTPLGAKTRSRVAQDSGRQPGPATLDRPAELTDHAFEPWRWPSGEETCMHVADGHMCDRPREEHATGPDDDVEAEV